MVKTSGGEWYSQKSANTQGNMAVERHVAKAEANKRPMSNTVQRSRTNHDEGMYIVDKAKHVRKIINVTAKHRESGISDYLNSDEGRRNVFHAAQQMAKVGQDVVNGKGWSRRSKWQRLVKT